MRALLSVTFALLVLVSCNRKDNSSETDRATKELTQAQSELTDKRREVVTNETDIERRKRELALEQQALADKEKLLASNRQQLGSAAESLSSARTAYGAAVASRFAKLDASLAALGTKTDAASLDAAVGLRARREHLAAKIASMSSVPDAGWTTYAKDVDTTFDRIERDLAAD